jgi:hypothetical protein
MSPGAFFGRPGASTNPFINPAVGAPVHGPGYFDADSAGSSTNPEHMNQRNEPIGYFPPVPVETRETGDVGYFPPMSPPLSRTKTPPEQPEKEQDGWLGTGQRSDTVPSPLEIDTQSSSSAAAAPWNENGYPLASGGEERRDKEVENQEGDEEGGANDLLAPLRTQSLTLSTTKIPALIPTQRSDSDPVSLQTSRNAIISQLDGEEQQQQVDKLPMSGLGLGLGLGV